MKKLHIFTIILLCFLGKIAFAQSYSYPYIRFANPDFSSKVSYLYFEYRTSPTDTIAALLENKATFLPNCLRQKTIYNYKDSQTGRLAVDRTDSLVYENGQLKTYFLKTKSEAVRYTLSRSRDFKIDTVQTVITYSNNTQQSYRSILLRNQRNQDSLYFEQMSTIPGGVFGNQYIKLIYNNANQLTDIREGYSNNGVIYYTHIQSYTYSGANITSNRDSGFNYTIGMRPILSYVAKYDYKYNALGQKTEQIYSSNNVFSSPNVDTFQIYSRDRYTILNAKGFPTESFSDSWDGRKWTERGKGIATYKQDTLLTLGTGYDWYNNAWRYNSRVIYEYCSLPNSIATIETLPLSVSPNPANTLVTISSDATFDADNKLLLFNHAGQLVLERSHISLPYVLEVSNLPQGLYSTKISSHSGQSEIKKFVIVK
jgi:hypothetical protein